MKLKYDNSNGNVEEMLAGGGYIYLQRCTPLCVRDALNKNINKERITTNNEKKKRTR